MAFRVCPRCHVRTSNFKLVCITCQRHALAALHAHVVSGALSDWEERYPSHLLNMTDARTAETIDALRFANLYPPPMVVEVLEIVEEFCEGE